MPSFTDQIGRSVFIPKNPQRIISLVPSQTELLHALGLDSRVAGITKFCVHPTEWFQAKTRIGGTKDINVPLIRSLRPDLIIAGKEENVAEQIASLWDDFPTWVSDVFDIDSALQMIREVGAMTETQEKANSLSADIKKAFNTKPLTRPKIKAAYLIWRNPYMAVGGDTFIHHMMAEAGFENVFQDRPRYPVVTFEDIQNKRCDVVLLSSEPYPFKEKHAAELKAAVQNVQPILVDGEMFSWYGSRLLYAPKYFEDLYKEATTMLSGRES